MKALRSILAALLILSVQVRADSNASIRGQVLPGPGETDLPGVVMVRIMGPGVQQVTYVSGGHFSFSGLPRGDYTIYVTAQGREDTVFELPDWSADRSDLVTVTMGARTADANVPPSGNTVVDLKTLKVSPKAHEEMQKGLDCLDKTEFQKAEKHFKAAIGKSPEFYQAHNNLGIAYLRQKRLEEAEKEFAKAVEIQPENAIGLKNLAYLRMNQGRPKEAIDPLSRALQLESNDATAEMYLGEAYVQTKDFAAAKEHLLKAVLLNPALIHAHYRLGYIFVQEKVYDEALKHFQAFLKLNPPSGKEEVQAVVGKLEQYFKDSLARTSTNPGF
ncbi:MAG: tetratricopeptide repeat protein [Acidobacteria bacterium]|nr:MAG: tetratricopeptide repeat protein [Acidobacteriota bacterium]